PIPSLTSKEFPNNRTIKQHIDGKASGETWTQRDVGSILREKRSCELWVLVQIGGYLTRKVCLPIPKMSSHQVKHPADLPSLAMLCDHEISFLVILHEEAWLERLVECILGLGNEFVNPGDVLRGSRGGIELLRTSKMVAKASPDP